MAANVAAVRDAINSGHPLPNTMRKRPGEVSDDSDEELDMDDQPLVPMEKAIVGFFFAGFFMVVLMLVGLTRLAKLVFLVVSVFAIGVALFTDAVPSAPTIPKLNTD